MKKILSPAYSLKLKNINLLLNQGIIFLWNGLIGNVVSTLPNVVKTDVQVHVVLTLPNIVEFDVEIHNVVSTLFQRCWTLCDVAKSYQPKSNVEPTLKCLLGYVRVKTELKFCNKISMKVNIPVEFNRGNITLTTNLMFTKSKL